MGLYHIAVRALVVYVFILTLLRLSGKHTVAQATTFDFVLALILGDMFDDLFWTEVPTSQFVVATGVLVIIQLLVSLGCYASETFSRIAEGEERMFMRAGSMLRPAMRREQMSEKEIEMLLRQKEGLEPERWAEVKSAWLEKDGQPGILKQEWAKPAQKQDGDKLGKAKP
jgi:uncharacterized membrane protein YcaP (DUF421 family)